MKLVREPKHAPDRWLTRRVAAWALYDVASSPYPALVATFFGLYFVQVVAAEQPGAASHWGLLASLSLILAGVLAPLVGVLADQGRRRLHSLILTTLVCVAATIALSLTGRGDLWLAAGLFVAAQVGYTLAAAVYDSMLVEVAGPRQVGRASGFGWALGLVGGIAALALAIHLVRNDPPAVQIEALGRVFLLSGALMGLIGLPALIAIGRNPPKSGEAGPASSALAPVTRVLRTLRQWRSHRDAFRMMAAYYLINEALVTVTFFVAIVFRARYGLNLKGLLWLSLLFHLVSLPATLLLGHLADRWDKRKIIYAQVGILSAALALLALGTGSQTPQAVVLLLGLVFGSLQAVCRSLFADLVPPQRASELFGFNAVAGRISAALGPLMFTAVTAVTGSQQAAVLSLIPFLVAGAYLLRGIRLPAAQGAEPGGTADPRRPA